MKVANSPIFIAGRPRSGTTLMAALMDAHPRIAILPGETHIFGTWQKKSQDLDLNHRDGFDRFWLDLTSARDFPDHIFDPAVLRKLIEDRNSSRSAKTILTVMGEMNAQNLGKPRWGEKSPPNYFHLEEIFESYPDARVILMMRDPRAIFASLLKMPWNDEDAETSAWQWIRYVGILRQWAPDPRIRVVRYEQLVARTQQILRELCAWLGEDYTDGMLNRSGLTHRLRKTATGEIQVPKSLGPITTDNTEKWKSELDRNQIKLIEHFCGRLMRELDYKVITRGMGPIWRFQYHYKRSVKPYLRRMKRKFVSYRSLLE